MIINRQIIVYIFSLAPQCHATQKGDADVASVSHLLFPVSTYGTTGRPLQESDTDAVSVPRLDVWSHESAARSSGSVPRLLVLLNRV